MHHFSGPTILKVTFGKKSEGSELTSLDEKWKHHRRLCLERTGKCRMRLFQSSRGCHGFPLLLLCRPHEIARSEATRSGIHNSESGRMVHSPQPTQRKPICSAQEISVDVWSRNARKMSSCRRNGDWNGTASTSCSVSTCPPTQSLPLETGCGVSCFSGALQELRHCNAGIAV